MSPTSSNLGIQNIGQISIIVHDLQRATAFYRDVLGLPLLFTVPNPRLIAPMPTYDLWMAAFRDSEGNIHQLMSEVPRAK